MGYDGTFIKKRKFMLHLRSCSVKTHRNVVCKYDWLVLESTAKNSRFYQVAIGVDLGIPYHNHANTILKSIYLAFISVLIITK